MHALEHVRAHIMEDNQILTKFVARFVGIKCPQNEAR